MTTLDNVAHGIAAELSFLGDLFSSAARLPISAVTLGRVQLWNAGAIVEQRLVNQMELYLAEGASPWQAIGLVTLINHPLGGAQLVNLAEFLTAHSFQPGELGIG